MAIPNRIIEGIHCSELKAEDYYSTYGKENIDQALLDLEKSDREILEKFPVDKMHKAVEAKVNKNKPLVIPQSAFKIVTYAAAAVFIAAIAIPVGLANTRAKTPVATERTKGPANSVQQDANLYLYRQNGSEIQVLPNGANAKEGDVIQITYQAGQNDYGIIFSVDGNGNITKHFPDNGWTAEPLKHGNEEVPLDFSYELDNAPDFECFIFVGSEQQFSLDDLQNRIKNKTDLNYLKKLSYLPKKTSAITYVLEK